MVFAKTNGYLIVDGIFCAALTLNPLSISKDALKPEGQ